MGKRWRKYSVGRYRLGQLNGQAVVTWTDEQGPHRRRLGRADSEVAARALLDAWARTVSIVKAQQSQTVGELWAAYRADRIADGKIARNFDDAWRPLAPRFSPLPVDAITADVCRDYARDRIAQGVHQGSVWTELTRLRSCINWAVKRRVIPYPAPYVWIPSKPAPKQRVLDPAEVIALLDNAVMPHVRLFILLAITTGARSSALLELTWDRVDFDAGTLDLRTLETSNPLLKTVRKHRAVVPMSAAARAALQEAKAGSLSNYVIDWDGEPIKKIRKGFAEACRRAGLTDVTPHTLRHSCASWLASDGVEMERIARHLGHRDPATTRRVYAKPAIDHESPKVIDLRLKRQG